MSETQKYRLRELYGRLQDAQKEVAELRAENERLRNELLKYRSIVETSSQIRYVTPEEITKTAVTGRE